MGRAAEDAEAVVAGPAVAEAAGQAEEEAVAGPVEAEAGGLAAVVVAVGAEAEVTVADRKPTPRTS